jgi:hypothetical protein
VTGIHDRDPARGLAAIVVGEFDGERGQSAQRVVVTTGTIVAVIDTPHGEEGLPIGGLENLRVVSGTPRATAGQDHGVDARTADMEVAEAPAGKAVTIGEAVTHILDLLAVGDGRRGFPATTRLRGVAEDVVAIGGIDRPLSFRPLVEHGTPPGVDIRALAALPRGGHIDADVLGRAEGFLECNPQGLASLGIQPDQGAIRIGCGQGLVVAGEVRVRLVDAVLTNAEEELVRIVADQPTVGIHRVGSIEGEAGRTLLLQDGEHVRGVYVLHTIDVLEPLHGHFLRGSDLHCQSCDGSREYRSV